MAAPNYTVKADLDRDASGVFESDWTSYVFEAIIHKGRKSGLDEQEFSTLELVLNNADGRFSKEKGTLSGLDYDSRVQVLEGTNTSYRFTGFIVDFDLDPHSEQQIAVITCIDLLGISEAITINMGNVIDRTTDLVLNRVLDLMEAGEGVENHGCETNTDDSTVDGSTVTRDITTVFEGDGAWKCVTDNNAIGEGFRVDVTDLTEAGKTYKFAAFIYASTSANLYLSLWDDVDLYAGLHTTGRAWPTGTGAWEHVRTTSSQAFHVNSTSRAITIFTAAQEANTFYADGLHIIPFGNRIDRSLDTGLTTLDRVAFGEERADVALRKVVDSEPGLMWVDGQGQFVFKNRNNQFGNTAEDFGYETQGTAGTYNLAADNKLACKQTLANDGYVESLDIYCGANSGTANVRVLIYADDSGPDALKVTSPLIQIDDTDEWKTFAFDYPVYLAASDYWLGLIVDAQVDIPYDAGDAGQTEDIADTFSDGPADPFGAGSAQARECSIHCNYRWPSPELNWADDGSNKQYQSLKVHQSADNRIRFVRIRSGGNYTPGTASVKFWEYEPLPLTVPARVPPKTVYRRIISISGIPFAEDLVLTCSGTDADHLAWIGASSGGRIGLRLENYTLTDWSITSLYIEGKVALESTEENIYEHEETSASPYVFRPLEIEMPFLAAAEDEPVIRGEAARLGKYVDGTLLAEVGVIPQTDASLTEILALELRDCVTLQSDTKAQNLGFDKDCWVEGIQERITWGKGLGGVEFVFSVEAI